MRSDNFHYIVPMSKPSIPKRKRSHALANSLLSWKWLQLKVNHISVKSFSFQWEMLDMKEFKIESFIKAHRKNIRRRKVWSEEEEREKENQTPAMVCCVQWTRVFKSSRRSFKQPDTTAKSSNQPSLFMRQRRRNKSSFPFSPASFSTLRKASIVCRRSPNFT